jgi:hypothetical protein
MIKIKRITCRIHEEMYNSYSLTSAESTGILFFYFIIVSGVSLSPLGLLYQPQIIDDGDCGMKIGRGNWSTRRKPAPAPLCPPQIPHDQTWARIRAAAVGSQRLTAWAIYGWSFKKVLYIHINIYVIQSEHVQRLNKIMETLKILYTFLY